MREYVIVTDSCCDFSQDLIRDLDLTVIPLSVQLGEDRFRNCPDEAPESHVFYTRLSRGEPAQTSAPDWLAAEIPERTSCTWVFPLD